jgi:hypothetical protein
LPKSGYPQCIFHRAVRVCHASPDRSEAAKRLHADTARHLIDGTRAIFEILRTV